MPQKEEVELKLGESWGSLCQPSLFPLLRASAPGPPVIDSSPIKSEERLTCDLKLSPSQPRPLPPFHLHANSLFTEYAPPPLAMNSGQGPRQWADYHLPTKQERGKNATGGQYWGITGQTLSRGPDVCSQQRSGF